MRLSGVFLASAQFLYHVRSAMIQYGVEREENVSGHSADFKITCYEKSDSTWALSSTI